VKTWIKRLVYSAVGLGLAGLVASAYAPKPLRVEAARIERGPLRVEVLADGQTRVKHRFIVSAPLAGIMARPELHAGDPIKQGDAMVSITPIDPPLLDARSRAQAEAQARLARAAQAQAEARASVAKTALEYAASDLGRQKELFVSGSVPRASLESAELSFKSSEQELAAAKLGVEVARFQVQAAEASLLRTSSPSSASSAPKGGVAAQAGAVLRAPASGQVLRVLQQDGGVVPAGAPLFEVGDAHDLEIVVDLLSTDAVKVKPGAAMTIERWGGEGTLAATVRYVEPSGFTKVSALGIEEQRVNVIAELGDPPERRPSLGDGYRIEARVVLLDLPDVVRAPVGALFRDGEQWAVYVVEADAARLVHVTIGHRNPRHAEVLAGLEAGARVIVHPGDKLKDGVRVAPDAAPSGGEGAPQEGASETRP